MEVQYNHLTQMLLLSGYTQDNYPKHVKLPGGVFGENALQNIYGGFEYQKWYVDQANFQTGCGLYVKGQNCISNLSYMGIEWCFENDNVVVKCPYRKNECNYNTPILRMNNSLYLCTCHASGEYQYELSIEQIRDMQETERNRLFQEYKQVHNGRICVNHMQFDEDCQMWRFHYNPMKCVSRCISVFCPVRNRALTKKKGNIFYDLRVSTKRKDGTFFDGQPIVSIEKGRRVLDKQVSIDICEAIVERGTKDIYERIWWNEYSYQKIYDSDLQIEILNLRAESRESRDLDQDLQDIKNGIHVIMHESDNKKAQKERKRRNKEKRMEQLIKKIRTKGYDSLNVSERRLVDKKMDLESITCMEEERKKAKESENRQICLSDWMGL